MKKISISMNNCHRHPNMVLNILLCMVSFGFCIGYDIYDDGKRPELFPLPRIGRGHWAWIEDNPMPFPRVGRSSEEKRQGLIPFPRIGRSSEEEDDDILGFTTDGQDFSYGIPFFKRGSLAFTPRIGRRKRSVNSQESLPGNELLKNYGSEPWNFSEPDDYDDRLSRDLIPVPRFGRRAFVPRVGKKSDGRLEYIDDGFMGKRAAAFTPRIGRAPLVPRIGRSDPSIDIQSRAAFVPRIGRAVLNPRIGRAALSPRIGRALIPRVGRSESKIEAKENQKSSS